MRRPEPTARFPAESTCQECFCVGLLDLDIIKSRLRLQGTARRFQNARQTTPDSPSNNNRCYFLHSYIPAADELVFLTRRGVNG